MGPLRRISAFALIAAAMAASACDRRPQETTPAEVTAKIRAFAAERCGEAGIATSGLAGFEPGYLRVADISRDGSPDYVVDFSALRCGEERPVLCADAGCPREIWVSDGRGDYALAFGMAVRAFALNQDTSPPTLDVTLAGDACPAPAPREPAVPPADAVPAREAAPSRPDMADVVCRKSYVFDPIRLNFLDADRAGAEPIPARDYLPDAPATPQTP